MSRLVIGLGSTDRGDDAVGPVVAARVAAARLPGVSVLSHEDPTGLVDLWRGRDTVVVVDAVHSGAVPGTVIVAETTQETDPFVDRAWARTGRSGTHAFGLASAVELSRALHALPERLVLVGVEAAGFEHGAELSFPVDRALDEAVRTVTRIVTAPEA